MQISYISNSKTKKYVLAIVGTILLLYVLMGSFILVGLHYSWFNNQSQSILIYQKEKIKLLKQADILFFGDSSLGNAVDSEYFAKLSNQSTVNLALTGLYGFGGNVNLVRLSLDKVHPKTIIFIHHGLIMKTSQSHMGYMLSLSGKYNDLTLSAVLPFVSNPKIFGTFVMWWWDKLLGKPTKQYVDREIDFISQRDHTDERRFGKAQSNPLRNGIIDQQNIYYLKKLIQICQKKKIRCIYSFGPVVEPYCNNSMSYFQSINNQIKVLGFLVDNDLLCMPLSDLGDTIHHVRPNMKKKYTRIFYTRLKHRIKP